MLVYLLDFFLLLFTVLTAGVSLTFSTIGGVLSFLLFFSLFALSLMTRLACSLLRFLFAGAAIISFETD